jgi:hypothetical protein
LLERYPIDDAGFSDPEVVAKVSGFQSFKAELLRPSSLSAPLVPIQVTHDRGDVGERIALAIDGRPPTVSDLQRIVKSFLRFFFVPCSQS